MTWKSLRKPVESFPRFTACPLGIGDQKSSHTQSLVVDQDGNPHLSYQSVDQGLVYATLKDENWVWEIVDSQAGAGAYSDIVYFDSDNKDLKLARAMPLSP